MRRRELSVEVPGGRLVGSVGGEGREVLLLHGGPGLSDYLDSLLPELDGMQVATYQQRGLAPSTTSGPFDVATQVADVVAVLDGLGWERTAVVGHSWGGHLLLHLMCAHPERLSGALVVDPLGAVGDGGLAEFEAELERRTPEESRVRARELDERAMAGQGTEADMVESLRLFWPAYFADPARAAEMPPMRMSVETYAATFESIHAELPELAVRLDGCAVPTRFVHGAASPMPVTASTESAALVGASVDVVADAGHFPWLESPGSVRRSLDLLPG